MAEPALELPAALRPPPLIAGTQDDGTLNKTLNGFVWQAPGRGWLGLLLLGMAGTGVLFSAITITIAKESSKRNLAPAS